jgi:DNA-directed RNA polymerase specialized sigma24 family protein
MVTWQGSAPRAWPSVSSARRSPPKPSGSPCTEEGDRSDEEALRDAGDLIGQAEAEIDPGGPAAAPDDVSRERLRADRLLVDAVLEQGLGGPVHRALEDELIRYAVPVLRRLLADGRLVSKATQLRRPPARPDAWLYFTDDDRQEFAHDMVANALPRFTRVVFEARRWTPWGGASLKTYFVNACILQFARLQEKWLDDQKAVRPSGLEFDPDAFAAVSDPAVTVITQDEVSRLLLKVKDEQLVKVLLLRGAGWTAEDAAQQAGLTIKAAEGRLARFRKDLKEGRAGTEPRASRRSDTTQGGR